MEGKKFELDFYGYLLARIEIRNEKIVITNAIIPNPSKTIDPSLVRITELTEE